MNKTRILLFGISGKLGRVLSEDMRPYSNLSIIGGVDHGGLHIMSSQGLKPVTYTLSDINNVLDKTDLDIIVDCSSIALIDTVLDTALALHKPLLIATTGQSGKDISKIKKCAKQIPIVLAPNLSMGIATLLDMIRMIQTTLKGCDIVLHETHHNKKLDKPSGSAKAIQKQIQSTSGHASLQIHSSRSGNANATHELSFYHGDEVITLSHTALSRHAYTKGAICAIEFLTTARRGLYRMCDCVCIK